MAKEISILVDGNLTNGKVTNRFNPGVAFVDQTNARALDFVQSVGTTEEAVTFTDFTGDGLVFLYNLDTVNYVEWGLTSSYPARLSPNDPPTVFRLNSGATLYLKANSAACDVRIVSYDV